MKRTEFLRRSAAFLLLLTNHLFYAQWVAKAPLTGVRDGAVSWMIGNKFYVAGGNGYSDLQEYDPATNAWRFRAPIPQGVTMFASGFVINGKGYLCGGNYVNFAYRNALLEYDPATNTWATKAPFPLNRISSSCGFAIGNKGYICCGDDSLFGYAHVYEYDPVLNTWSQKASFGGGARTIPYGFAIGNKGYVGGGYEPSGEKNDLWEFDPVANTWTPKASMPAAGRQAAASFASSSYGFVGLGMRGFTTTFNDVYRYDPQNDDWDTIPAFSGGGRAWPMGFAKGDSIYLSGGWNFSTFYNDLRLFNTHTVSTVGMARHANADFEIYPNPVSSVLHIAFGGNTDAQVDVYNSMGNIVVASTIRSLPDATVLMSDLPSGVYLVRVTREKATRVKRIILTN